MSTLILKKRVKKESEKIGKHTVSYEQFFVGSRIISVLVVGDLIFHPKQAKRLAEFVSENF